MAGCTSAGTKLYYSQDNGSSSVSYDWTEVHKAVNINKAAGSIAEVDITTLDSVGQYKEFCPDSIDPGTITFKINLTDDSETQISALWALISETMDIKVEFNTGLVWIGKGFLNPPSFDVAVGQAVSFDYSIRLTGNNTLA